MIMIHLDPTVAQAGLSALTRDLYQQQAQQAWLETERDGLVFVAFPNDLTHAALDPDVMRILNGETNLFAFVAPLTRNRRSNSFNATFKARDLVAR